LFCEDAQTIVRLTPFTSSRVLKFIR